MVGIESIEFTPDSPAWARLPDLQTMLGFREVKSLDKWRDKLGRQHEHNEKRGPNRGVWVYLPAWLPAWADAHRSQAAADPVTEGEKTVRQRTDYAKAIKAELEVDQLRRELDASWVHRDDALEDYAAVGVILKASGDRMCLPCKQMLNDGLSDIKRLHCSKNGSAAGH